MSKAWAIGQLRHLYMLMTSGQVTDTKQAADGLLGPAIQALEKEEEAKWRGLMDGGEPGDYPSNRCGCGGSWAEYEKKRVCRGCGKCQDKMPGDGAGW